MILLSNQAFRQVGRGLVLNTFERSSDHSPCTWLSESWSKNFLINGSRDGSVRIRPLNMTQTYARSCVHDGTNGTITGASMSFDDSFLLTSSEDGSLFVFKVKPNLLIEACTDLSKKATFRIKAKKASKEPTPDSIFTRCLPQVVEDAIAIKQGFPPVQPPRDNDVHDENSEAAITIAQDITDPEAYSIQDDKLKTEQNTKEELAEIEKNKVRKVITQLREDFESLLLENERDDEETRLDRSEFNIDSELMKSLISDGKMQLEEVIKETQWGKKASETNHL